MKQKLGPKTPVSNFPCSDTLFYSFLIDGFQILGGRIGVTNDILHGTSLSCSGEHTQPWAMCWSSTPLLFKWQLHRHDTFGTGHIIFQFDMSILTLTALRVFISQKSALLHVWFSFIATFHSQQKISSEHLCIHWHWVTAGFMPFFIDTCFTKLNSWVDNFKNRAYISKSLQNPKHPRYKWQLNNE